MTRVVVDPKTGRMSTEDDGPLGGKPAVTAEDVARTRRELRDMLSGNTPFHVDELGEVGGGVEPNDFRQWFGMGYELW